MVRAILSKFGESYSIKIGAVESDTEKHTYTEDVEYVLNTSDVSEFAALTRQLNENPEVEIVLVQHEFGLYAEQEEAFLQMLEQLRKPVILVFHTVLSQPTLAMYGTVRRMVSACTQLVVMTQNSRRILLGDYHADEDKVMVIPHGTHLVSFRDKNKLKDFYQLSKEENKRTTRALFYGLSPVNALCKFDTGGFTECLGRFCGSGVL